MAVSGVVAVALNEWVGLFMGISSLGFWSFTNGMTAFAHRDYFSHLVISRQADVPPNTLPYFASIGGASFGMGAITAIGLIFTDSTNTAAVLAGVCGGLSVVSGVAGIITTFMYDKAVR